MPDVSEVILSVNKNEMLKIREKGNENEGEREREREKHHERGGRGGGERFT